MSKKKINPIEEHKPVHKRKKVPFSQPQPTTGVSSIFSDKLNKYNLWIAIALLFVIISLIYFRPAFLNQFPQASDTSQWRGSAQTIIEYNKTHKDQALWTPNMFSGMPSYLISLPNKYPFLDSVTKLTDKVMNWRIFLLFIGGLGIFLLLLSMGLEVWVAFFGAIAFTFSCHWIGLIEIGHNTKFRAIMWIPWILWGLNNLVKKPNLLHLGVVSVFLITQLRENHPQITYYLYLFIGMFWLYQLIDTFLSKKWKKFLLFTLLLMIAFGFTGLAVMNPYMSNWEYSKYTIRGGEAGLEKSYAQGWSFHPLETIGLIIPDFFGGVSMPELYGLEFAPYWGWMDFTQIYNYFGIVVLMLAFFALSGKQRRYAWMLWISSLIFLVMSFGKFFPLLSDLLLKYLPGFNKFRVPSMILIMVQINMAVLAALGLSAIIEKSKTKDTRFIKRVNTWFIISVVIFILWIIFAKSIFAKLPFTNPNEISQLKTYNAMSRLSDMQNERLSLLYNSGSLSLVFLVAAFASILLFLRKTINKQIFLIMILLFTFVDLWKYSGKYLSNIEPAQVSEESFAKRDYDEFLLADKEPHRIYPIQVGTAGHWAYYHQTIQGYHGAKLKRYQEILEECINKPMQNRQINWNVLNMLNVKYLLLPDSLMMPNLMPVFSSEQEKIIVHQNFSVQPRAWFVKDLMTLTNSKAIFDTLNSTGFNVAKTAIVEEKLKGVEAPDSTKAEMKTFALHDITYDVSTDKNSFLVMSEVYYPAGWKAYIDGKETKIYPADYILRGVIVPAGKHKLEVKFAPESYKQSIRYSLIGILLSVLALLVGIVLNLYDRKRK